MSQKPKISWRLPPVATAALAQFCRCIEPARLVSITLGMLLLIAAALKGHQFLSGSTADALPQTPQWLPAVLIPAELFLGLWLLSGRWPRWSWATALIAFSSFACYSLLVALQGKASCGCFGAVGISPWIVFAGDMVAIAALSFWGRAYFTAERLIARIPLVPTFRFQPRWIILSSWFFVAATGIYGLLESLATEKRMALFQPDEWINKRLPLIEDIDIGPHLAVGKWEILMYRQGCAKCDKALSELKLSAMSRNPDARRLALVDVASGRGKVIETPDAWFIHGRLIALERWSFTTPVHVQLEEGVIASRLDQRL